MADKKKKAAGNATSTAAKKNNSVSIIAEPIDIVNMTAEEIIAAAIGKNNKAGNPKPPEIKAFEEHYQQYLSEVFNEKRNQQKLQQGA